MVDNAPKAVTNSTKACLYGLLAAAVGGTLGGLGAYLDHDKWGAYHPEFRIALTALLGFLVAFAVKHGAGQIDEFVCLLASILTVVGKIAGDILYFSLYIARDQGITVSKDLLKWTALNLIRLKFDFSFVVFVGDILIVAATAGICWRQRIQQ